MIIDFNCRHSKSIHETLSGSHKFTIRDYSETRNQLSSPGQYLSSDTFTAGDHEWALYFYPHGKYEEDKSVFVSVFVVLVSEASNVKASFKLSLVDQSGKENHKLLFSNFEDETQSYRALHTWNQKGSMWGYRRFFYRTDLEISDYFKDDSLTMHCSVEVLNYRIERPIPIPPSDMSQSLKYLMESEIGSDVVFIVAGETFKAHKLILAARSPVFRAQFFGQVGNTNMDQVTLEEIDPPIFKAMLLFIYSDEFPNLHESSDLTLDSASTETLQHLLAAADRFGLERLKQLCEAKLCEELSADTVATTLLLADQHRCSQLKAICLNFVAANLGAEEVGQCFEKNLPRVEHRFCAKHLYNNYRKRYPCLLLKRAFWNACMATYRTANSKYKNYETAVKDVCLDGTKSKQLEDNMREVIGHQAIFMPTPGQLPYRPPRYIRVVMQSKGFKYLEESCNSLVSELLETIAVVDEKRGSSSRKRSSILDLLPDGRRRRL